MSAISTQSRIQGAILGAFIGDALALGPHWYYNLEELRKEYGDWIDDYTTPKEGRYHAGLKAGASSQSGVILDLTLKSLIANQGYDEKDFCKRLDDDLFPLLDGEPMHGPGGYTSQSIRDVWHARQAGNGWNQVASLSDNTEAAERVLAIAALYFNDPDTLAEKVHSNTTLTQSDPTVGALTCGYAMVLGQLLQGEPLDDQLSSKLMNIAGSKALPHQYTSPDALLTVSSIAQAVQKQGVLIEPAWKVSLLYGLPCAVYNQIPAAYHLAARFQADFESAVLHAVNGGGQNMSRAMLTGALCGAIGGIEAIPQRFIDGLEKTNEYQLLAKQLAEIATQAK